MGEGDEELSEAQIWALKLYSRSPLKQEKNRQISALLPDLTGKACLDVGSDNGVISYLLRQSGGHWYSCDLDEGTVQAIKSLVGERVDQIAPTGVPYQDDQFDLVVLVDILEHLEDDGAFVKEIIRILKPGGEVIVNVPNPKEGLLRKFRYVLGQTDEEHGHVRPGYTPEALADLLGNQFTISVVRHYSRLFSVLTDTLVTFGLDLLKGGARGKKGRVVTTDELAKMKKSFMIFSLVYPFIAIMVLLDRLFPWTRAEMLIAKASL